MNVDVHFRFRMAAIDWLPAKLLMAAIFAMLTVFSVLTIFTMAAGTRTRKETAGTEQADNAY
jgi:hypothetical protein